VFKFDIKTNTITGDEGIVPSRLEIPTYIHNVEVKTIGENAFSYMSISEVVLNEGVDRYR